MYYVQNSNEPYDEELLEAVIAGKCIIFEGEEDPKSTDEQGNETQENGDDAEQTAPAPDDGNEQNGQDNQEGQTGDQTNENATEQPQPEQPAEEQQNTAETVNTDEPQKGTTFANADQIATMFMNKGLLKSTVDYAKQAITGQNKNNPNFKNAQITVDQVKDYIKDAVEKFCQSAPFHTSVPEMAKAAMRLTMSCGQNHAEKNALKTKLAKDREAKKQEQQKPQEQPQQKQEQPQQQAQEQQTEEQQQ